ncbi:hypothetical protein ACJMK2_001108 [Sinanodonta woodiana]|uniref:C-type lectin domain-containing protein n=1 Tax=Sinanodonta woodiana TaxID=1069815 RepID=A0ABD3XUP9_SINWO
MENLKVALMFLIFVAVNLPTGGNAAHSCPRGFELHGRKCYIALDLNASWPVAKEYCTIIGGKLAAIANAQEQAIIAKIVSTISDKSTNPYYWLDGSDILVEGEWRWMGDRGNSVPFTYTNWHTGEPNLPDESCLEVRYEWQSKWNNAHCWIDKSFICEARAIATEGEIEDDILQEP